MQEFYGVYLHEVGHALGSSHSEVDNAAMSPFGGPIAQDDIDMIQFLYGQPETPRYKLSLHALARD